MNYKQTDKKKMPIDREQIDSMSSFFKFHFL